MRLLAELADEDKPREKLLKEGNAKRLRLEELIAILIGSGTQECDAIKLGGYIGEVLMEHAYKTSKDHLVYNEKKNTGVKGVGPAKACVILAALELARRFPPEDERRAVLHSTDDILPFLGQYRFDNQENVIVATLSGANEVIRVHPITRGTVNQSQIHPREVFAPAIEDRAASIILIHNHPSGNLTPSPQDVLITERIKQAGELLGITLLDHLIIGPREPCRSIL
ncbi:MAG TPA: DNA repair protein RadC [Methanocorpusculum sp.]|nr:DNA repair protein RadC [Methanocorpusculum sp.]